MIAVFEELKHLIVLSGLPPYTLALRSGVSYSTIDKWLDGRTRLPRIDTMLKIAQVVGKEIELTESVRRMVNFYGAPPPPPPSNKFKVRPFLWRLQ